jgi:hypothetical protein
MMAAAKAKANVQKRQQPPMGPLAYTIREFCQVCRVSKSQYFRLREEKKAPKEMRVGRRVLISAESAQAWLKARELEGT